jgi:hypothetical protein
MRANAVGDVGTIIAACCSPTVSVGAPLEHACTEHAINPANKVFPTILRMTTLHD